ncbi:hypothetical protein APR50_43730 [Variovorax paradoxus]|nr:hypothetical protein APR50_43730 [Variovorax paradoxus]KPU88442.1 hypothetical protein APR49_43265 [Variovorax paradoxus]KPV15680.1 hypothetical protein APR47_43995 [Variovorax paradoxus]KPV15906.1 hypothetical protein APR48_43285 [Variovorax paradoxus]
MLRVGWAGRGKAHDSAEHQPCPECLFGLLSAAAQHRNGPVSIQRDLAQGTSQGQHQHQHAHARVTAGER